MGRLVVKKRAEVITEFSLKKIKNMITIGSDKYNDISLPDKKISGKQVQIEQKQRAYFVSTLREGFGTFLNNQKLEGEAKLFHGDLIVVGDHCIEVLAPELGIREHVIPATKNPRYFLVAIYGPLKGKRYELNFGHTGIGRDDSIVPDTREPLNHILINRDRHGEADKSISRRHATIEYRNNNFYLTDRGGKTTTYHNKRVVPQNEFVVLKENDEIEIVSEKTSSIFRFVKEGNWNVLPPLRAGVWWVRHRFRASVIMSIIMLLLAALFLYKNIINWSIIAQKPAPLTFNQQIWYYGSSFPADRDYVTNVNTRNPLYSLVLYDFNKDGKNDIGFQTRNGDIKLCDGKTGTILWSSSEQVNLSAPLVAADMNGDGYLDIIAITRNAFLSVLDGKTGNPLPKWRKLFGGHPIGRPAIGDIDGNGMMDLAVYSNNILFVGLQFDDEIAWREYQTDQLINSQVMLANLIQTDHHPEIVIGTDNGIVEVLDVGADAEIFLTPGRIEVNTELDRAFGTLYNERNAIRGTYSFVELPDGTGMCAIITRQFRTLTMDVTAENKRIRAHKLEGDYPLFPENYPAPLLVDVTMNAKPEVISAYHSGAIYAFEAIEGGANSDNLWSFKTNDEFVATPALADFNKDGIPDVIIAGREGVVYVLDGATGKLLYQSDFLGDAILSTPVIGDVDADGYLDILVVNQMNDIYLLKSNAKYFKNTIFWSQSGGDKEYTNSLMYSKIKATKYFASVIFMALLILGTIIFHGWQMLQRQKWVREYTF